MEISIVLSNDDGVLQAVLGNYLVSSAADARASAAAAANSAAQAAAVVGTSLLKANNLSDLVSAATARTNLGLGSVALLNNVPITSGGTGATTQTGALSNILGSSVIPLSNGGTGAATQGAALTNILGSSTVPLTNGGTGASSAASARSNLGLGTAAIVNTGTSGGNIPLLNGANTWSAAQTFSVRPTFNSATPWDSANLPTPQSSTGVTNASNAAAGQIGEYANAANTTGSAMTSGTAINIASLSLTAGDWDVSGATLLVGSTSNLTQTICGINTVSATSPAIGQYVQYAGAAINVGGATVPMTRISVSATTTVYLVGTVSFSSGSCTGYGSLRARRVR